MIKRSTAIFLALVLCSSLLLHGCKKAEPADLTISVRSEGGAPLSDVYVYVYEDAQCTKMVWGDTTDDEGMTEFTGKTDTEYTVTLKDAPKGYKVDESYTVSSEDADIILETALLETAEVTRLGDVFFDFSVTDINGNTHTLSELLETKKAVVLNFWFINCGPCRMEFPYLQAAYEAYSEDIAVIAINPYDGNNTTVSAYAEENGLTFPVVKDSARWVGPLELNAYPTTVVIDRYGTVAMMHTGAITEEGEFEKIFNYFTRDGYVQSTIRGLNDINDIK